MAEHSNVAVVRNAYESLPRAISTERWPTWPMTACSTSVAMARTAVTTRAARPSLRRLIKNFELTAGTQVLDIKGIYADDAHAAVVLHETASRPDGASIAMDEVHILRLRDGKVHELWDLPEDIESHDDFFDGK